MRSPTSSFLADQRSSREIKSYLYQNSSGVLRHQVRRRVEEFAKTKGCMPIGPGERKLQNALSWPTVFEEPPFIIADLGDIKRHRGGKDDIE